MEKCEKHNTGLEKAMEMAREFSDYCKEQGFSNSFVVMGVAYNADKIYKTAYEKGYLEGKAYERERIAQLLGLST